MSNTSTTDLGAVTAYADAKAHGYTGTREEFGQLLANAGINLQAAKEAKEAAANSASAAATSAGNAGQSATKANTDATNAAKSASNAANSATASQNSADAAAKSAAAAKKDADATDMNGHEIKAFMGFSLLNTTETFTGNHIQCTPGNESPLAVTVQGETVQAGEGKASPENIRALSGLGASGTLTLTAAGGETRTVEIPLTGPLYTGDDVALDNEGKVVETHRAVKLTVDGSENWISWTNPRDTADITVPGTIGSLDDIVCSHYSPLAATLSSDAGLYTVSTNNTAEPGKTRIILRHGFKTVALLKEYLKAQADAGTPVTFVYKLSAATETPVITEQTVTPLRAIPAEDGSCTVSGEAEMTVSYRTPVSSKIREFEKRIAALEAKA